MTSNSKPRQENTLIWLLKILSGLFVIVILGIHLTVNHLVAPQGLLTYQDVVAYFQNPLVLLMEAVFLSTVVFHSLTGLRGIILDLNPPQRWMVWINRVLVVGGCGAVLYGLWLLWAISSRGH